MFIELVTQDRENYGTAEKPYWKNKGGTYYLLPVDQAALLAAENRQVYLSDLATRAMARIQQDGPMWQEHVIGWELVSADHYTESEFNQLRYEGHIEDWAALIELPD